MLLSVARFSVDCRPNVALVIVSCRTALRSPSHEFISRCLRVRVVQVLLSVRILVGKGFQMAGGTKQTGGAPSLRRKPCTLCAMNQINLDPRIPRLRQSWGGSLEVRKVSRRDEIYFRWRSSVYEFT